MKPATAADAYRARFRAVLEYIDAHLDDDALDGERLARVAAFSRHHFHRQFSALFGVGVQRYVQLRRLRRASYRLAFRSAEPVTAIALASGYDSPEAFARAFRKGTGQTPTGFRTRPDWPRWYALHEPLDRLRSEHMPASPSAAADVRIVVFAETRVAALEHRGDPRLLGDSIRRFVEWRRHNGLPPRVSATYNILHDDPAETSPADFRFDLCAAISRDVAPNPAGVVEKRLPGGRCAVLRHVGADATLGDAVRWLYAQWLPGSGESPRDCPLFVQRVRFFPDVAEHEAVTDVFLPIG